MVREFISIAWAFTGGVVTIAVIVYFTRLERRLKALERKIEETDLRVPFSELKHRLGGVEQKKDA